MENQEKEESGKGSFLQGWGLIVVIIVGTITVLVGINALFEM